jgi:deoxycytidine triphosphate deaminase
MSLLTDVDIRRELDKNVVIVPFEEKYLSPIGYDCSVGDFVFSLEFGLLKAEDGSYIIRPKDTVQIMTRESIWLSNRIAGTLHSRVSLVSKGLSHISTTIDPTWYGPLLVTLTNLSNKSVSLRSGQRFVTVVLFNVKSATSTRQQFFFIQEILVNQLQVKTDKYIERVAQIVGNKEIAEGFREKVELANRPMFTKIAFSLRNLQREQIKVWLSQGVVIFAFIANLTLRLYWSFVQNYLGNIEYDATIIASQLSVAVSLLAIWHTIKQRQ